MMNIGPKTAVLSAVQAVQVTTLLPKSRRWCERPGKGMAYLWVDGERVDALEDPDFAGGGLEGRPILLPRHVDLGRHQGNEPDLQRGVDRPGKSGGAATSVNCLLS